MGRTYRATAYRVFAVSYICTNSGTRSQSYQGESLLPTPIPRFQFDPQMASGKASNRWVIVRYVPQEVRFTVHTSPSSRSSIALIYQETLIPDSRRVTGFGG